MTVTSIPTWIPLEGACNARHLGGYPTNKGSVTRKDRLIRCDSPVRLTEADLRLLRQEWKVKTVLDLRDDIEVKSGPGPFADNDIVSCFHLSLLNMNKAPHFTKGISMAELYIDMLENSGDTLAKALRVILEAEDTVLFHCTAGKDRTGVLAALLLFNAGVDRETVLTEYGYSEILLEGWRKSVMGQLRGAGLDVDPAMMHAYPVYLGKALQHLTENYGDAAGYLTAIGITAEEQRRLARRLTEPDTQ